MPNHEVKLSKITHNHIIKINIQIQTQKEKYRTPENTAGKHVNKNFSFICCYLQG